MIRNRHWGVLCAGSLTVFALLSACAPAALRAPAQRPADLVVRGARIYTVDTLGPWAEALAVRGGRLVFLGADSTAGAWIGPATRVVDAGGRLILPGFHDAHAHLVMMAGRRQWCDLGYPSTLQATRDSLAACVARSAGRPWVLAMNPNTAVFPQTGPPSGFLDSLVADRPMVVNALHSSFANGAALALAGVTAATPDPEDGRIVRDAAGRPTGTLIETAQALVLAHVPRPSADEHAASLAQVLAELPRYGVVSVQDPTGWHRAPLYAAALATGQTTARVRLAQVLEWGPDAPALEEGVARFVETARRHASGSLNAGTVKIFVDGDLGDRTAALLEPYADAGSDGWRGEPIWSPDELNAWAVRLDAAGLQMHFHAVGDRAVRMALDAVSHARTVNGPRDARHQITHLHLVSTEDLPRFRSLGVVANVQPYFAENIDYNTVRALELLGPERQRLMFRFRDLVRAGAALAATSDATAAPPNPLVGIRAALTRREARSEAPAFLPEQRLTLPEVLAAYTIGGAYANFLDDVSGSLEVGKWADLVMLDRNLFELAPDEIEEARVLWTLVEGREVYRAPAAEWGGRGIPAPDPGSEDASGVSAEAAAPRPAATVQGATQPPAQGTSPTPEQVVRTQFDAYNRRDLDAFMATLAPDARMYLFPDSLLFAGHEQLRPVYARLFAEATELRVELLQRLVQGAFVIDRETTYGMPGRPPATGVAIYEVRDGLIVRVWFVD